MKASLRERGPNLFGLPFTKCHNLEAHKLRNPETLELFSTLMGIVCVSVFFSVKKSFCKAGLCGSKAFGNLEDMGRDCKVCWKIELFSVDSQLKVLTQLFAHLQESFPPRSLVQVVVRSKCVSYRIVYRSYQFIPVESSG